MRYRKLTQAELDFIELNPEMLEIKYYPKYAKKHRTKPSIFRVNKGFAFIFSNKILSKFKKCEIISVTDDNGKHYNTIKESILGA